MFSVLNRDVLWGLGLWIAPHGLCEGIILLVVSALQVDGSFDCGHTALLPVWMNCSKVMSCTKSLTGNKARQISLNCNWARDSASGPQALAYLQVLSGTSDIHMHMSVAGDDWLFRTCGCWTVMLYIYIYRVYTKYLSTSSSDSVTSFPNTLAFSTFHWIIELFLSRGPVLPIRFVGDQVCFTAPSPEAAVAFMLPHDIEKNHSSSLLTFQWVHHLFPLKLFL